MKFPVLKKENAPPQKAFSMEEYTDFVGFFLENTNPENARAQKMREERITTPFSILDGCGYNGESFPNSTALGVGRRHSPF